MFWNQKSQGLAVDSEPEEAPTQLRADLGRAGAEWDPALVIDVLRVRAEVAGRRPWKSRARQQQGHQPSQDRLEVRRSFFSGHWGSEKVHGIAQTATGGQRHSCDSSDSESGILEMGISQ